MFFDSLGHTTKDVIIGLLIIFIIILSVYIILLNGRVTWWTTACKDYAPGKEKHRYENEPEDHAVMLAWIFIAVVTLIVIYSIFTYRSTGKIVGLNSMGNINGTSFGRFSF